MPFPSSSPPLSRIKGTAILYVDLAPLHLHPGPWESLLSATLLHPTWAVSMSPTPQSPLLGKLLHHRSREPQCARDYTPAFGLALLLLPCLHITVLPTSSRLKAEAWRPSPAFTARLISFLSQFLLFETAQRKTLKDPPLTWGQAVRSMAAIAWSLSQKRAGAGEKGKKKRETSVRQATPPRNNTAPHRRSKRHVACDR